MKLLHTMIRVTDKDKSLKFYQEVLGLKIRKTMELTKAAATLYFLADEDGNEIELTYNHTLPEGGYEKGTHFGHFAFRTDDMERFSEHLKSLGHNYTREPFLVTESGPKIAFIEDPDGLQIEIIERKG